MSKRGDGRDRGVENTENMIESMGHELSLLRQSVSQLQRDLSHQQFRFLVFFGIVLSVMIFGFVAAILSLQDKVAAI
jgi:uncharacterized membrane protein (DUF106 family)